MARTRPIMTPATSPPGSGALGRDIHDRMGSDNIRRMIADFYDELAESSIAGMFPTTPDGLEEAAARSGAFFVFLLGGPPEYQQRYGPPRMRARHLPFEIDEPARQEWLRCFGEVLDRAVTEYNFPEDRLEGFVDFLVSFSAWMVNAECE